MNDEGAVERNAAALALGRCPGTSSAGSCVQECESSRVMSMDGIGRRGRLGRWLRRRSQRLVVRSGVEGQDTGTPRSLCR